MAKKPLLFVDTNIFLDFYRAGGEAGLTLLEHIEKVSDLLMMTDQVEMEFLNNRQTVISAALAKLTAPSIQPLVPAYLSDTQGAASIAKSIQQIKKRIESMKQKFAKLLKDPSGSDPVFKMFKKIVANSSRNLKNANPEKQKEILEAASQRSQRGFPPRKKQDHSLGDAINWEWILDCAKDLSADVLIVSRDGDFGLLSDKGYLNDWLAQEFKEKVSTKRKAELTPSLTQALKKLGVKVTAAEEKEEQNIIRQTPVPAPKQEAIAPVVFEDDLFKDVPGFWHEFRNNVRKRSPFMNVYLNDVACATFSNNTFVITYPAESADVCTLVNNTRNQVMFQSILKELGVGDGVRIVMNRAAPLELVPSPDNSEPSPPDNDDVPF